jgi:acyl-CoA synthetase (AMP-forming)/AMP-acid ligase II
MTVSWAIHRLNGISSPASAAYSASELAFQLKNARATCLFTCRSLLPTALRAAEIANIPRNRIYLLPVANLSQEAIDCPIGMKSLDDLISRGKELPALENLIWSAGQGKRQTAFICYSSGTSGLPVR